MESSRIKTIFLWIGIVCLCFIAVPFHIQGTDNNNNEELLLLKFNNFTKYFNKTYNQQQILQRLPHFKRSLEQIELLNSFNKHHHNLKLNEYGDNDGDGDNDIDKQSKEDIKNLKYWKNGMKKNNGIASWGLTSFADLSPEEFQSIYLDSHLLERIESRQKQSANHHHHHQHYNNNNNNSTFNIEDNLITRKKRDTTTTGGIPDKVDWREKNILTPVKHQKSCGACWAFSTVETVESMVAIQGGKLQTLSIQQLIDCSKEHNMGCNGGDTCTAIQWMSLHKLATEQEYPLTLKDGGKCKIQSAPSGIQVNANYSCGRYVGKEDEILEILANHGPVAVAVDATNWQYYMGGVIQWNCDTKVNHAVQMVGYDKTSVPPHYILRNSWGPGFGDNGYLYVAIGSNLCGIAVEVTYLTVK